MRDLPLDVQHLGHHDFEGVPCSCRLAGGIGTVTGSNVGPDAKCICLYSVPSTTRN